MENYDVIYSMTEKRELENSHKLGKYSFQEKGSNECVLSIGGQRSVTFRFELEKAEGALYTNAGAASMREYLENEEASHESHIHLFAYIGVNKIDLYQDLCPSELRIKNTHVTGGMGEDSELEFEMEVVFTRDNGLSEWKQTILFSVPMHGEERYTFTYASQLYDSIDGQKNF